MPNLINIIEMAQSLGSKPIFLVPDRCVVVRNRHSSCQKCSDACPVEAVFAVDNMLQLDADACIGCGACTTVCPTEALIPLIPLDEDLATSIVDSAQKAQGSALFVCARKASKNEVTPACFAEVPCLARMEESVLLGLASRGVQDIVLVDGTCSTCKYRACSVGIDATVASTNNLLAAQGSSTQVVRISKFPACVLGQDYKVPRGEERRGFFTQAKGSAKEAVEKTVEAALSRGAEATGATLQERLRVSDAGTLPQFNPVRRMNVLDSLDRLGGSVVSEINTRLFGRVEIDAEACSACSMCTVFCPTGALKKSDLEPEEGHGSYLEFSSADCVQCNLCADACITNCLTVGSAVFTDELFDFEPRLIWLPDAPKKGSMLGNLK